MTATLQRPPSGGPAPRPAPARPAPPAAAPPGPAADVAELTGPTLAAALATVLGSLALLPVYVSRAWLPPVVAAVAVVALGGLVLRAAGARVAAALPAGRPAPALLGAVGVLLVPLGQLVLLACLLVRLYAPGNAPLGFVPGPGALFDLNAVLLNGTAELQEQATPALPLTGLLALTALTAGLVAVVVDLVAVGARRPAPAGLALLVLYCIPVGTVVGGIGLLAVAAPACGLALLLWSDQRRSLLRRLRPGSGRVGSGGTAALRTTGVALVAGLVLGAVVPTLSEGTLASGFGPGRGGASLGTSLDPVAELRGDLTRPDPVPLMRLRTPLRDPGYLRSVVLDQYDAGRGWTQSNLDGEVRVAGNDALAPLPARPESREVTATIDALQHDDRYLPVPYSPLTVRVQGARGSDWRFDEATATVFGRGATTGERSWTVTSVEPRPTEAQLEDAAPLLAENPVQDRDTALPPLPAEVTGLVQQLTADQARPYDRVRAVQGYLSDRGNGFIYSLSTAPGTSGDDLVDFLTLKRGYCEQYAGAMAVMVRAAGVPARVVLGYTPGSLQPDGTRLVTTDDAHSWVEAYFEDLGWVPFDPTPLAVSRQVDLPWAPRADSGAAAGSTTPSAPVSGPSAAAPSAQLDRDDQFVPVQTAPTAPQSSLLRPVLLGLGVLAGLALVLGTPAAVRAGQRRRRVGDGSASALWDELLAGARDLGIRPAAAATPRQTARDLAALVAGRGTADGQVRRPSPRSGPRRPDGEHGTVDALRRLALAEEAASYGRSGTGTATPELVAALRTARRGLRAASSRRARLAATLWPLSLVAGLRTALAERLRLPRGPRTRRTA